MAKKHSTTSGENGNVLLPLSAESASINTATITIRTVQVGKKQMTQSVFRQLPEAPMVDEEKIELLGVPWGWVNYRWGDIDERTTHFIHQIGGRLYRCAFLICSSKDFRPWGSSDMNDDYCMDDNRWNGAPWPFHVYQYTYCRLADALHSARIIEGWRPEKKDDAFHIRGKLSPWVVTYQSNEVFTCKYVSHPNPNDEYDRSGGLPERHKLRALMEDPFVPDGSYSPDIQEDHRKRHEENVTYVLTFLKNTIARACDSVVTASEVETRLKTTVDQARDYRLRWDTLMDKLRTVEQLFIAV